MSFRVQRGISPLPRWERAGVRVIGVDMGASGWMRVGCLVGRPRPLTPFPLTLALSHEGRGDCW